MKSPIKLSLLLLIAALPLNISAQRKDTISTDTIPRRLVMHRIVSKELRDLISDYDKMYAQYTKDPTMGLVVYCDIRDKTVSYSVLHMSGIGGKGSLIICEPINGKEVAMHIWDLNKQIVLPQRRSVELLKNYNAREYQMHKEMQKRVEEEAFYKDCPDCDYGIAITYDFISWEITFDKRTGKVLSKRTPDLTKQYEKAGYKDRAK